MAVNGLGHGIDYILEEASELAPGVKILRVVDECMAERMAYWNFWAILNCQVCEAERGCCTVRHGRSITTRHAVSSMLAEKVR